MMKIKSTIKTAAGETSAAASLSDDMTIDEIFDLIEYHARMDYSRHGSGAVAEYRVCSDSPLTSVRARFTFGEHAPCHTLRSRTSDRTGSIHQVDQDKSIEFGRYGCISLANGLAALKAAILSDVRYMGYSHFDHCQDGKVVDSIEITESEKQEAKSKSRSKIVIDVNDGEKMIGCYGRPASVGDWLLRSQGKPFSSFSLPDEFEPWKITSDQYAPVRFFLDVDEGILSGFDLSFKTFGERRRCEPISSK